MKLNTLAAIAVASFLAVGMGFAQNGPGKGARGQGKGYGAPPQSVEEKAARQAACLQKNGGVCPQGGPGLGQGKGQGQGKAKGQGKGLRLRDGTGPRCSLNNQP